jgi:hypothetical protein
MQALFRPSLATPLLLTLVLATVPCFAAGKHAAHGKKEEHASKGAAVEESHGPLADLRNVRASKESCKSPTGFPTRTTANAGRS